jgi:hypothetical protein
MSLGYSAGKLIKRILAMSCAVLLLTAGCSRQSDSTAPTPSPSVEAPEPKLTPWPAPPDPMERAGAAGLTPEPQEFLINHVHAHLDIFVNGKPVAVPAGIGIDITNPAVMRFEDDGQVSYGGIDPPCDRPCISPLHTHDESGVLHTESKTAETHTLGQFFTEWGLRLDASCVDDHCKPEKEIAVYVNGDPYNGDPASIPLNDRSEIAIVIGDPPARIPRTYDFSNA